MLTFAPNSRAPGTQSRRGGATASYSAQTAPLRRTEAEMATPPPAAASSTDARPGVGKLLDAMKSLGMSTAGLDISYGEDVVGYPGGSYVNRLIKVTSGGKTEQFSAELTERNALVTAYEIQRYLGVPSSAGGTSGLRYG